MSATPDTQVHINNLKYLFDCLWFVWPGEPHPSIYRSDLAPEFSWEPLDLHRASWYLPHHPIRLDWVTLRRKKQKHWTEAPHPPQKIIPGKMFTGLILLFTSVGACFFFFLFLIKNHSLEVLSYPLTPYCQPQGEQMSVFFWIDPSFVSRIITGEKSRACTNKGETTFFVDDQKCPKRIISLNPFF